MTETANMVTWRKPVVAHSTSDSPMPFVPKQVLRERREQHQARIQALMSAGTFAFSSEIC